MVILPGFCSCHGAIIPSRDPAELPCSVAYHPKGPIPGFAEIPNMQTANGADFARLPWPCPVRGQQRRFQNPRFCRQPSMLKPTIAAVSRGPPKFQTAPLGFDILEKFWVLAPWAFLFGFDPLQRVCARWLSAIEPNESRFQLLFFGDNSLGQQSADPFVKAPKIVQRHRLEFQFFHRAFQSV